MDTIIYIQFFSISLLVTNMYYIKLQMSMFNKLMHVAQSSQ